MSTVAKPDDNLSDEAVEKALEALQEAMTIAVNIASLAHCEEAFHRLAIEAIEGTLDVWANRNSDIKSFDSVSLASKSNRLQIKVQMKAVEKAPEQHSAILMSPITLH
jgi:hypothetical protein